MLDIEKPTVDDPIVITLLHPITFGSRHIDRITIRPVKAKHLRAIKQTDGDMAQTLLLASKLSGELPEIIDELEGQDLGAVLEAVNRFLSGILPTGGTSSGA